MPDMPRWETLGQRLRRLRRERGLTQRQIAEHLNTDTAVISGWERDRHKPYLEAALVLADLLCVTTDYLGRGKESRHAVLDV